MVNYFTFATGVYDGLVFNKTINGMSAICVDDSFKLPTDDVHGKLGSALTLNDVTHFALKILPLMRAFTGIGEHERSMC